LRWLATAAGAWLLLFATGLLATDSSRRNRARLVDAVAAASPVASVLPMLAVLYGDDPSFHLTTSGPQAPARLLTVYIFALALASVGVIRLCHVSPGIEGCFALPRDFLAGPWTALATGAVAVAAMTALNLGLFGPLARHIPVQASDVALGAGNLVALGAAAYLAAGAVGAPSPAAVVLFAAALGFAPLSDSLPASAVGGAMLAATLGLLVLARGSGWLLPLAGAALVACAPALAWLPALPPAAGRPIFWSAPHAQNAAVGAFFSRLYAGPGALTAASAPPVAVAEALAAGTSACFGLLALWFLWRERPFARLRAVTAACLALIAVLALWPTTPPSAAALVPLALVPLAAPPLWSGAPAGRRARLAGLTIGGYLLAGTSTPSLSQAATELLARWPPLASLPSLGLVLLALALALALHAIPRTSLDRHRSS
jgi:hypothetical protein